MQLNPDDIKQVFFYCENQNPEGYYADGVDILEFGQKVVDFAMAQRKPMDDSEILDFMCNVDLKTNGDQLLDRVKSVIRTVEKFHGIT